MQRSTRGARTGATLVIACAMLGSSARRRPWNADARAQDPTASAAPDDSTCALSHTVAHANPDSLLAEFLTRDAAGEFLDSSAWFDGATQCPGQEPAPDGYQVIDRYTTAPLARTPRTAAIVATSTRVGIVSGQFFTPAQAAITDTVRAIATPYGWRVASPSMRNFVLRDVAVRRGDLSITAPASRASSLVPDTAGSARSTLFWAVIDSARAGGGGCTAISRRLAQKLRAMPDSTLEQFSQEWASWWNRTYDWDLWGAAYIINGGSSDDGFDYFRGWLLTEGSGRWTKASSSLDSAFDDVSPFKTAECEAMVMTLPNEYEARFHRKAPSAREHEPRGRKWNESDLATRFPRLSRHFGPRGILLWLAVRGVLVLVLLVLGWKLLRARSRL